MNRLVISIIILSVMTIGCIAAVFVVGHITDDMSETVSVIADRFTNGDSEGCIEAATELQEQWDIFLKYSILVNDLGHAVELTSAIAEVNSFARMGNEELYAACDRVQAQIKLFRDSQRPTFWKIL